MTYSSRSEGVLLPSLHTMSASSLSWIWFNSPSECWESGNKHTIHRECFTGWEKQVVSFAAEQCCSNALNVVSQKKKKHLWTSQINPHLRGGQMGRGGATRRTVWSWTGVREHGSWGERGNLHVKICSSAPPGSTPLWTMHGLIPTLLCGWTCLQERMVKKLFCECKKKKKQNLEARLRNKSAHKLCMTERIEAYRSWSAPCGSSEAAPLEGASGRETSPLGHWYKWKGFPSRLTA